MHITKENTGDLTATIRIELEPADYQEKVNSQLKDYQHKANMPGFRPGKVPFGLIKKMYGKAITIDVVQKEYSQGLSDYLLENNIEVMASPLANKEINQPLDLDNDTNLVFYFDIALAPEFTLDISDKLKVDYLKIAVTDETRDKYITEMRKRNGPVEDVDAIGENDMVSGQFIELDDEGNPKEGGIKNDSFIYMEQMNDETAKKKLIGLTVGESVEIDPKKLARSEYEQAYFLGVKKEQLAGITSRFNFLVKKVTRTGLAEMNEEFYSKIFPNRQITSEDQFKEMVRNDIDATYAKECENKFLADVVAKIQEKHDFELPDAFLKRFLLETDEEGKLTPENIDKEYESMKKQLKWQLIESKMVKQFGLDVTPEDEKAFIKRYFRQNREPAHDHHHEHDHDHEHDHENEHDHEHDHEHEHEHEHDHQLDQIADIIMKNEKQAKEIRNTVFDEKIKSFLKSKVAINEVETTYDDFVKLISSQNK